MDFREAKNATIKEQALINEFNTLTPKQLLVNLSSGNHVSAQEVIINTIREKYNLTTPVTNVLIHYVLLHSNMKLSKPYMEKIASHWSRAGLETAEDAMNLARIQQVQIKRRNHNTPKKEKQGVTKNNLIEYDKQMNTSTGEKSYTTFERRYMENLYDKYGMNFDVSREIILYGRKVNNGLTVYWFLDGVSDYVYRHNAKTASGTQDLLKVFHNRFVKDFGMD